MMLDLAVIGAGPAGLSAGLVAHTNGLRVMVLERSSVAGGQILRADHEINERREKRAGHAGIEAEAVALGVIYIHGHWLDVNSIRDLEQAGRFTAGQR